MVFLSVVYGAMNILSFVALRNIGAGLFTIFAQLKILTTTSCSVVMLDKHYSWVKWRAILSLIVGVLIFSESEWNKSNAMFRKDGNSVIGIGAVLTEVTLSGFASIYFEKVIKVDVDCYNIWERNFQLALGSFPMYIMFIVATTRDDQASFLDGWSIIATILSLLGAAGGLLVALSIKHGDSVLKTLATTGAIILSSLLDHQLLGGPLTAIMILGSVVVINAICSYTFDPTPVLLEKASLVVTKEDAKEQEIPPMSEAECCSNETKRAFSKNPSGNV